MRWQERGRGKRRTSVKDGERRTSKAKSTKGKIPRDRKGRREKRDRSERTSESGDRKDKDGTEGGGGRAEVEEVLGICLRAA